MILTKVILIGLLFTSYAQARISEIPRLSIAAGTMHCHVIPKCFKADDCLPPNTSFEFDVLQDKANVQLQGLAHYHGESFGPTVPKKLYSKSFKIIHSSANSGKPQLVFSVDFPLNLDNGAPDHVIFSYIGTLVIDPSTMEQQENKQLKVKISGDLERPNDEFRHFDASEGYCLSNDFTFLGL